ncbi:MAG: D-alanyl-D-alanine carboxypeptidase/D-alanyl-D-alanine-endopeptidase [Cyclobacteriaceae bacterium]
MVTRFIFISLAAWCAVLGGCSPSRYVVKTLRTSEKKFQHNAGFLLYDPDTKKTLIDYHGSTYFTPASNTKIFTFYGGLQLLSDSVPALQYAVRNDSLIFWGTGDPSFLYEEVFQNGRVFNFLKNTEQKLFFSDANYDEEHFGPGWSWGDYRYSYSPERSPFPMNGNCVTIGIDSLKHFYISPGRFVSMLLVGDSTGAQPRADRAMESNQLTFYPGIDTSSWKRVIPFRYDPQWLVTLLGDTLKREVQLTHVPLDARSEYLYSIPSDSLYKVMMQESDNFIAEQLLLMYGGLLSDTLNQGIAIDSIKEKFLFDLPDEAIWMDGSGLSRYNLFTPASIVRLWEKIALIVPQERLFNLLAVGGEAGTISNLYKGETPYIFGKTGTLRNNHCLSGFILTKNGKTLIFSIMNNNYTVPSSDIRQMMEQILVWVRDKY